MKILINASNLKKGGGLQVADSVCGILSKFPQHYFIVVLSHYLESTMNLIKNCTNICVVRYDLPHKPFVILTGRDKFLDNLILNKKIDVVLTIFGPSLWHPRILHISGFARPHCVIPDSPYFKRMNIVNSLKARLEKLILLWAFNRCADIYYTENEFVSNRLRKTLKNKPVYTVTNYYNQIFDNSEKWTNNINLQLFNGVTLLTIAANYAHKNMAIIVPTLLYLRHKYPEFKLRFVLTITKEELGVECSNVKDSIVFLGKVPLSECPHLYQQCDIVFSSTLLECFSATYPEAMRMGKPIITTDLEVIRSLCGDAALYYDALSPESFGEAIYKLANDKDLQNKLINNGKQQLQEYDNYEERAQKLINIVESEYNIRNVKNK